MSHRTRQFENAALPHLGAAYNLARWLLRDPQQAEDAVQEAYLRAFRFFDDLRAGDARPWLMGIVRNACHDWLRQQQRRSAELQDDFDTLLAHPAPEATHPAQQWEQRARSAQINAAVRALPPHFREVIVLRELEDMAYEEIARVVGIPLGTVMSRLSRARALLREALSSLAPAPEKRDGR